MDDSEERIERLEALCARMGRLLKDLHRYAAEDLDALLKPLGELPARTERAIATKRPEDIEADRRAWLRNQQIMAQGGPDAADELPAGSMIG